MKTIELKKSLIVFLVTGFGLGNVSLAQLYSSGNNAISGSDVGIGTDDPQAKLEIENLVILPAGGNGPSAPAVDDPALRISTTVNPNNNTPSSTYTWDIKTGEDMKIIEGTGLQSQQLLKLSQEESQIGGEEVLIADDFHFGRASGSTSFKYTLGIGARMNGTFLSQTSSGNSGVAIQNHNGTLRMFTGIGTNTSALPKMTITNMGKVGIGTTNPGTELEVKNGSLTVDNGQLFVEDGDVKVTSGRIVLSNSQGVNQFEIKSNGYVVAREILVDMSEPIPDYVFKSDYDLMPINELRNYIATENHLPNIPSAADYEDLGGVELGELSRLLLEKQEELVLYILELEERINELETANKN